MDKLTTMMSNINNYATKIEEGDTSKDWSALLKEEVKSLKDFEALVLKKMNEMKAEPEVEVFNVPVEIGMKVRCKITGYEGIVVVKNFNLHRIPQFDVQSKADKFGSVGNSILFDECQLEVIDKNKIVSVEEPKFAIDLGACVKDTVTNFVGTVIARELHMNGCVRLKIRCEYKSGDKTSMSTATFDEPSCKVVEQKKTVKPTPKNETTGCSMTVSKTNWN